MKNKFLIILALLALSLPAIASNSNPGGQPVTAVQNSDGTIGAVNNSTIVTVTRPAITGDVSIPGGSNAASISAATVTGKALTGFSAAPGTVTATDTILTAFNKIVGNITSAVTSVFGRTGAVTAQSGDYSVAQVTGAAPLASPTFTGTVILPAGQVVNGVTLNGAGSSSLFLNQAGGYTAPAGAGGITALTGMVTASGTGSVVASLGSFSSANLATALTDETGTGANVFANGPTLVAPLLGTPASGVLTNATGLPLTTGITGILGVSNGGTGTASPGLVAGTNVTITGSWPNQTVNASGTGVSVTAGTPDTVVTPSPGTNVFTVGSNFSAADSTSGILPVNNGGNQSIVITTAPYNASGFIQQTVLTGTVTATTTNIPVASSAGFTVGQIAIFGNCGTSGTKNFAGFISAIPDSTHITVSATAVTGALLPATSTSGTTGAQASCFVNYPVYTLGTTTLGTTVVSGATSLPLTTSASFKAGQGIKITGGGAAGVDLIATIVSVASNTVVITPGIANAGGVSSGAAIMHDDTAAFQAAFNVANYNTSVSIQVPDGFYQINGQPQNTGTANAAIQLPSIDYYPSSFAVWNNNAVIRLYGNTPAGENQSYLASKAVPYMSGAIIHSDLNSSQYNWFGAYDSNSDLNFTNVLLQVNNITFRSYPNPNSTPVDCVHVESCQFNNVSFDTGETGSTTQPTHTTSFAWRGPGGQNGGNNVFNNIEVLGFYNGSQLGEHTRVQHIRYDNVLQPIVVGGNLVYGITGVDIQFNGCPHGISVGSIGGQSVPIQFDLLNIEHQTSPPSWITNVEDINDPSNRLFGIITIDDANGNVGTNPPTVTGGANLVVADAVQSPAFPFETTTFAGLSNSHHASFPNGKMLYCSDCTTTPVCAGSGTGAWSQRLNSTWSCNGGSTSTGTITSSTSGQVPVFTAATTLAGSANFTASAGAVTLGTSGVAGSLIFNGATSGTSTISVPAVAGTSRKFQLPPDNGTNTFVLQTDGTGITTWVPAATGGAGTVTTVSVVTANGVSGSVANATTTPAITLTLGAITPTTVNGVTIPTTTDTVALLGTSQSFTKGQAVTPTVAGTQSAAGTLTPDFSLSNSITFTFGSGNLTIANPTNVKAGQTYQIVATQDAVGSRLITWGGNFKWPGSAPTLSTTANAVDQISCFAVTTSLLNCLLSGTNFH